MVNFTRGAAAEFVAEAAEVEQQEQACKQGGERSTDSSASDSPTAEEDKDIVEGRICNAHSNARDAGNLDISAGNQCRLAVNGKLKRRQEERVNPEII